MHEHNCNILKGQTGIKTFVLMKNVKTETDVM